MTPTPTVIPSSALLVQRLNLIKLLTRLTRPPHLRLSLLASVQSREEPRSLLPELACPHLPRLPFSSTIVNARSPRRPLLPLNAPLKTSLMSLTPLRSASLSLEQEPWPREIWYSAMYLFTPMRQLGRISYPLKVSRSRFPRDNNYLLTLIALPSSRQ